VISVRLSADNTASLIVRAEFKVLEWSGRDSCLAEKDVGQSEETFGDGCNDAEDVKEENDNQVGSKRWLRGHLQVTLNNDHGTFRTHHEYRLTYGVVLLVIQSAWLRRSSVASM
jgi:hypothetical protein